MAVRFITEVSWVPTEKCLYQESLSPTLVPLIIKTEVSLNFQEATEFQFTLANTWEDAIIL